MINFPMPRESIMGAWIMPEGVIDNIKNIIYVDLNEFDVSQTKLIAHQIEKLNIPLGHDQK